MLGSTQVVAGRYRLVHVLGRGGSATVWRAWDVRLDRAVAVKVLDPGWGSDQGALQRLWAEAHAVARLAHPNIVAVRDLDRDGDVVFLVMDLVDGRSLADLLAAGGPLPVEQAVGVAAQVCQALMVAHQAGVVHRGITPGNILIDPAGTVRVGDFGLASMSAKDPESAITAAGSVIGSGQCLAPEQATGGEVDARTDLYALGCVLYTMLAGVPPVDAAQPVAVLHQHLPQRPVPLGVHRPDIPASLDQLVSHLRATDPADRPATAGEVYRRLTAVVAAPAAAAARAVQAPTQVLDQLPAFGGRPGRSWLGALQHRLPLPGWLAALVAAAVVTSVLAAVAVLTTRSHQPQAAPPPRPAAPVQTDSPAPAASPTDTPTSSARPRTPLDQLAALATAIRQQADDRQLDRKAARELLKQLTEVARRLSEGDTDEAAKKFADVREKLADLRRDGKLTPTGYAALPDLDQLGDTLDAARDSQD